MARLTINGKSHDIDVAADTPLLWAIRDHVGLTGTKYGCGIAQCGACTVHIDGQAVRACSLPVSAAECKKITTIEGLAENGALHSGALRRLAAQSSHSTPIDTEPSPNGRIFLRAWDYARRRPLTCNDASCCTAAHARLRTAVTGT